MPALSGLDGLLIISSMTSLLQLKASILGQLQIELDPGAETATSATRPPRTGVDYPQDTLGLWRGRVQLAVSVYPINQQQSALSLGSFQVGGNPRALAGARNTRTRAGDLQLFMPRQVIEFAVSDEFAQLQLDERRAALKAVLQEVGGVPSATPELLVVLRGNIGAPLAIGSVQRSSLEAAGAVLLDSSDDGLPTTGAAAAAAAASPGSPPSPAAAAAAAAGPPAMLAAEASQYDPDAVRMTAVAWAGASTSCAEIQTGAMSQRCSGRWWTCW